MANGLYLRLSIADGDLGKEQLEVQIERGKLTKEIIDTMIDTVYVYDKKRIEVILRFDDVLQKVISEYMEGAKGA